MKVLLIEDDVGIASCLKKGLATEHCVADIAPCGKTGITLAQLNDYDAIVLDFHLGDMKGDAVSTAIRTSKPSIPILVLSVETGVDRKVDMLSICDDYMTKPCDIKELSARLHALVRRGAIVHEEIIIAGPLVLDSHRYVVTLDGVPVVFRNKEFALLEYLMRHRDMVLSREMILSHVWDMNADPFTNTVDTHIRLLRKKLETPERIFIHTVPKRGYRFSIDN
jgi:DNA-binding response OmpR family regulator